MDRLAELKFALYAGLGEKPWQVLTFLGEAGILLPVAALTGVWLWRTGRVREAQAWGFSVLACVAMVGAMKLGFGNFKWTVYGHTFNAQGFPSGHTAMATVFWGGIALISATRRGAATLLLLLPIPVVALAVLVLWWHHTLDIVVGFFVGAVSLLPLLLVRVPRRSPGSAF